MHRYLTGAGCQCGVFFLGEISVHESALIAGYRIEVFENASDQPPEKLVNRIRWYRDATIHQARNWLSRVSDEVADLSGPGSLTLNDFRWPWAVTRFAEVVGVFRPNAIIFEYIKMAYLIEALTTNERARIKCLIDTHDVLHLRAEQFFANGFPHWLRIDRAEESQVLQNFDAVMAIQDEEAETFRNMLEDKIEVITVGHAVEWADESRLDESPATEAPSRITIGYIGSKNFSNWQAIRDFLNFAWPTVMARHQESCELVIAGAICDWFDRDADGQIEFGTGSPSRDLGDHGATGATTCNAVRNVRLLGRIDHVETFYKEIDVMINPVKFGTGLKIKNAESLRYGKLLITTLNGFVGMPEATRLACMVVESVNEMGLAVNSICSNLSQIRPMQQLALQLAQTEFSESQAYSQLNRYLG